MLPTTFRPEELRSQGNYFSLLSSITTPEERASATLPQSPEAFSGCCFGISVLQACSPFALQNSFLALSNYDTLSDEKKSIEKKNALTFFKDAITLNNHQYQSNFNALLKRLGYRSLKFFTVAAFIEHRHNLINVLEVFFKKESLLVLGMLNHAIFIQKSDKEGFYLLDSNAFHPSYQLYFKNLKSLSHNLNLFCFPPEKEGTLLDIHLSVLTDKKKPTISEKDFFPFLKNTREISFITSFGLLKSSLQLSIKTGCHKSVKFCLGALEMSLYDDIVNPFVTAMSRGHISLMKTLLAHKERKFGSKKIDLSAIHYAIENNKHKAVSLLLSEQRTLPEGTLTLPLISMAASKPDGKILKILLRNIEVPGSDLLSRDSLFEAIISGSLANVKTLNEYGVNFNFKNEMGISPLYLAIIHNKIDITKYILNNNPDLTLQYNFHNHVSLALKDNLHLLSEYSFSENDFLSMIKTMVSLTILEVAIILKKREAVFLLLENKKIKEMLSSAEYLQKCSVLTEDSELISLLKITHDLSSQRHALESARSFTPRRNAKRTFSESAPISRSSETIAINNCSSGTRSLKLAKKRG